MKTKRNIKDKGGIEFLLLGVIVLLGIMLSGGLSIPEMKQNYSPVIAVKPQPQPGHENLQLRTFPYVTVTPTPLPSPASDCGHDSCTVTSSSCACAQVLLECANKKCSKVISDHMYNSKNQCTSRFDNWCAGLCPKDGTYCLGKPVIYLYPLVDTVVNVKVMMPGYVYKSIPLYNSKTSGWDNILVHPGGEMDYQNKKYHELYYESSVVKNNAPATGITIAKDKLRQKLLDYTFRLGLLQKEQQEFLEYWLPKLQQINKPYIYFSVLTSQQKNEIDKVTISPQPNTFIEFIIYFKGVDNPVKDTLILPQIPPQRVGFTAVEWGGTIDY